MLLTTQPGGPASRQSTAPGLKKNSLPRPAHPDPTIPVETFSHRGQETPFWRKAVLGTMAGVAGFTAIAQPAQAAPAQSVVTRNDVKEKSGLEVMVLPHGTPRIELIRKTRTTPFDHLPESLPDRPVGVHLGAGIFHDSNGNLFLVPSLAAGWKDGVTDFKRVEAEVPLAWDDTVSRYSNTVHFKDSPYDRTVYVELGNETEVHHQGRKIGRYKVYNDGVEWKGQGERNRIAVIQQKDGRVFVDGPINHNARLKFSPGEIDVDALVFDHTVRHDSQSITVRGGGSNFDVRRSGDGKFTRVDSGYFSQHNISRHGDVIRTQGTFSDRNLSINPPSVARDELNFKVLSRRIEAVQPGYAERHPLIMAILEYAVANPGLMGEGHDSLGIIKHGSRIAAGGGAVATGSAMLTGAQALALAENAQALGAAALASKSAAQTAAQAGQFAKAGQLAAQAQGFADKARLAGGQAMKLGKQASNVAQVARVLTGVAGVLQMIDGGMDLHRGASSRSVVEGAKVLAKSVKDLLAQSQTGEDLERTQHDYKRLMEVLNDLESRADKEITLGGMKIGCGGLMLLSALAGGAVIPPVIGIVGMACTVGTIGYENWDEIHSFFKGTPVAPRRDLRDILPQPEEAQSKAR